MKLILTTSDSGAGALRAAGLADVVLALALRFVRGPLPAADALARFVAPRGPAHQDFGSHWLDHLSGPGLDAIGARAFGLAELCARCESVELWIDPLPNAQLQLIWLLDALRAAGAISTAFTLRQADRAIGDAAPEQLAVSQLPSVVLRQDHFDTANLAWQAYRAPTPQAWFDLLQTDLGAMPQLRLCVQDLLDELPARATGLGASEMSLLQLISEGWTRPPELFAVNAKRKPRPVFDYWETGALLDDLAHAPSPAVSGLQEGPFTIEMHGSKERFDRYKASTLSMTALGEAILIGRDDFSRHSPIHRWWGGTELTSAKLWRWDAVANALIAP